MALDADEVNKAVGDKLNYNCKCCETPCVCLPDYSRSIEAAWELTSTDYPFSIQYRSDMHDPLRRYWDCWFGAMGQYRAEADTAPMAIAKAFLKLNE